MTDMTEQEAREQEAVLRDSITVATEILDVADKALYDARRHLFTKRSTIEALRTTHSEAEREWMDAATIYTVFCYEHADILGYPIGENGICWVVPHRMLWYERYDWVDWLHLVVQLILLAIAIASVAALILLTP